MGIAFALRKRLQRNENDSLIRSRSGKTEAGHGKSSFRLRHIRQQVRNLLSDRLGIFQRSSRWRLDHDDEVALIFVRHEPRRHACEHKISEPQAGEKQHRHRQFVFQHVMQQATVPTGEGNDAVVKLLQPPPFLPVANRAEESPPAPAPE